MKHYDFQLLQFQQEVVDKAVEAIYSYDGSKNIFSFGKDIPAELEGKPKPYLHRIKAVTGAGKTPILAAIAAHLKHSIILWTTPRGAIIEQTTENLKGKYRALLGGDVEVLSLEEVLRNASWNRIIERTSGCTIITTTVASFNQKNSKNLTIHKGDPSPWQQLCTEVSRPVWVFYDEGHNATENQFKKLLELQPKGFVLASASPLAADLQILLPGEDKESKEHVLNEHRTTSVDTRQVVAAGLLKRTIEIHDLDTGEHKILQAAYQKRAYLEELNDGNNIVACYIVDRDSEGTGVLHGLHIWEQLIAAGADPCTIAVHLSGAEKAAEAKISHGDARFRSLIPTYDKKFGPGDLKEQGFKHIIWNLSLEEGWDEPWAYVGYFHGEQSNESKIIQRIGRLIRNPFKGDDGLPMLSAIEPLRSVYCYLNSSDNVLKSVVARLQNEMDTSCMEILVIKESADDKHTEMSEPKAKYVIPKLSLTFDPMVLEQSLFKALFHAAKLHEDAFLADGKSVVVTMAVGSHDEVHKTEEKLSENIPAILADVVKHYLAQKDVRLIRKRGSVGGWISPLFWRREELQKPVNYSSDAYYTFRQRCDLFVASLDKLINIDLDNDEDDPYVVPAIKLINPNGGDTETKKRHYKVHSFKNAVHDRYNGLNNFELEIALVLDECGVPWARNPSRTGYGIPLVQSDNSSTMFYPDFIAWKDGKIFFIETKGLHLLEETKQVKLTRLPKGMYLGVITQEYDMYTLLERGFSSVHQKSSPTVKKLIKEFMLQ